MYELQKSLSPRLLATRSRCVGLSSVELLSSTTAMRGLFRLLRSTARVVGRTHPSPNTRPTEQRDCNSEMAEKNLSACRILAIHDGRSIAVFSALGPHERSTPAVSRHTHGHDCIRFSSLALRRDRLHRLADILRSKFRFELVHRLNRLFIYSLDVRGWCTPSFQTPRW